MIWSDDDVVQLRVEDEEWPCEDVVEIFLVFSRHLLQFSKAFLYQEANSQILVECVCKSQERRVFATDQWLLTSCDIINTHIPLKEIVSRKEEKKSHSKLWSCRRLIYQKLVVLYQK